MWKGTFFIYYNGNFNKITEITEKKICFCWMAKMIGFFNELCIRRKNHYHSVVEEKFLERILYCVSVIETQSTASIGGKSQ